MARDWWDELAGRPGGYAITWNCRVEGPNAQAIFDRMVLEMAAGNRVLDCGCGDGAFTLEVAKVAEHVVGLDYSQGMLDLAKQLTAQLGVNNVTYCLGHARQTELSGSVDLAITRRGPDIRRVVPEYVRQGGRLCGIHPMNADPEVYAREIEEAGLRVLSCERYLDRFRFPTLNDLAGWVNRQPGMPDVRRPEHQDLLMAKAAEFGTADGDYAVPIHYLVWLAERT